MTTKCSYYTRFKVTNVLNHHAYFVLCLGNHTSLYVYHNPQRGVTPLMKAADKGATHIALALLNAGAKTDLQDKVEVLLCSL